MTTWRRLALVLILLTPSVACDQVSKHVASSTLSGQPSRSYMGDVFRLGYAENKGAFLSLGASMSKPARYWVFTIGVAVLLLGLLAYTLVAKGFGTKQVAALSLMISGGVSNWVDRATNDGLVVDFMNLGVGSLRTGIFNVADVAIMAGVGMLLVFRMPAEPLASDDKEEPPA